ncbi:MAG: bifunctional isocitrate dehydrogenase kinase/phosphatase [Serratia liquefaciens]|nr:bifunctional isocitrate dehydrogenase kinase/phosphatase [Serratia liquefaciens]
MAAKLELLIAQTILQGFDAQYGRFLEVTAGAQQRFERADWPAVQQAMKKRIHLYDHHVGLVVEQLKCITGQKSFDADFPSRVKAVYTDLLPEYPRFEIAESFFNSVYCRLFKHRDLTPEKLFVFSSQPEGRFRDIPRPLSRNFTAGGDVSAMLYNLLTDLPLRLPWENLSRDIDYITLALQQSFSAQQLAGATFQIANELFYRNKAAWLVGKLRVADTVYPFLLPIHHSDSGALFIDTCLTSKAEASIVFGFARSYFMVYAPLPAAMEYLTFMAGSQEQFIIAPGVKGMVMLVFTLPSFDRVFKVIKDEFAPQKEVTQAQVMACYQLVKEHDRVGRMADTQEYENFVVDKARLSPELLAELQREVPDKLEDLGDRIVIKHLYMERRMTPLNLYLEQANEQQMRDAIEEYGNAIKQLAAANIFPGDMLFKNFGVTRHGRVVFYDYDEICYMTEVNFRDIPPPRYPEDELASEPWYSVSANDVFPEEFRHFLCGDRRIRQVFEELHSDLFEADYWRGLQQRIRDGHVEDVFAYRKKRRFSQRSGVALPATSAAT